MLPCCWKAVLRASGKSQAWGCSSSCDGPSPPQVTGSSSRTKGRREACLLPAPWPEQLGKAGEPRHPVSPAPLGATRAVAPLLVAQRGFLGLEGCGCPVGVIGTRPLHAALRLAFLVQPQQLLPTAEHITTLIPRAYEVSPGDDLSPALKQSRVP